MFTRTKMFVQFNRIISDAASALAKTDGDLDSWLLGRGSDADLEKLYSEMKVDIEDLASRLNEMIKK